MVDDYPLDWNGDMKDPSYYRICKRYRLIWEEVKYVPGELKAVAYLGGKKIGEDFVRTAGNGNPHDRRGFASKRQKLFFGRAMVAVRRTAPGEIKVKATYLP